MSVSDLKFADTWPNRNESTIGDQKVCFIGRADLLRNKRASGRVVGQFGFSAASTRATMSLTLHSFPVTPAPMAGDTRKV